MIDPGIYPHVSDADYFASPHLSHSRLVSWAQGKKEKGIPRAASVLGTAVHIECLIGSGEADNLMCVTDDDDERLTAKRIAEWQEKSGRRDVIKPKELLEARRLADAIMSDEKRAAALSQRDRNELVMVADLDVRFKAKIDCMLDEWTLDIKTTSAVDQEMFLDSLAKYHYYTQAAAYAKVRHELTGEWKQFGFLCVSKTSYEVWWQEVTWKELWAGMAHFDDLLKLYAKYGVAEKMIGDLA